MKMIKSGQALHDLPYPYNGVLYNWTMGIFSSSELFWRTNVLGKLIYLFVIGAQVAKYGVFHWSIVGSMLLILLFLGSSALARSISAKNILNTPYIVEHFCVTSYYKV